MTFKKENLIDFCFLFYILAYYANISVLFITLFKIPSPLSQLLNYSSLILVLFAWNLIPNKKFIVFNKFFALLLTFIFSYLIVGFLSTCFYNSLDQIIRIVPQYSRAAIDVVLFMNYFFYLYEKKNSIDKQLFYITLIFVIGMSSVVVFYLLDFELFYVRLDQAYGLIERPSGLYANPNIAARYCCVTLILLLYHLFNHANLRKRIGLILLILFTVFTIFITFSNTGQLAAIGIILIAFIKGKFLNKTSLIITSILLVATGITLQSTDSKKFEFSSTQLDKIQNLYNVLTLNTQSVSYSSRDYIVQETLRKSKENPITGFGLGSYTIVYKTWGTHNTYLGLLIDAGVIPLIIYIVFLLFTGSMGFLMRGSLQGVGFTFMAWVFLTGIYSFASHNVIDNGKFYFLNILFFILYSCKKKVSNDLALA